MRALEAVEGLMIEGVGVMKSAVVGSPTAYVDYLLVSDVLDARVEIFYSRERSWSRSSLLWASYSMQPRCAKHAPMASAG